MKLHFNLWKCVGVVWDGPAEPRDRQWSIQRNSVDETDLAVLLARRLNYLKVHEVALGSKAVWGKNILRKRSLWAFN